jgi:hypothetical protein
LSESYFTQSSRRPASMTFRHCEIGLQNWSRSHKRSRLPPSMCHRCHIQLKLEQKIHGEGLNLRSPRLSIPRKTMIRTAGNSCSLLRTLKVIVLGQTLSFLTLMIRFIFARTPVWLYIIRWISVIVVLIVVGGPTLFVNAIQDLAISFRALVTEVNTARKKEIIHTPGQPKSDAK